MKVTGPKQFINDFGEFIGYGYAVTSFDSEGEDFDILRPFDTAQEAQEWIEWIANRQPDRDAAS